jgi:dihydrolipoamide dehydrogenase
MGDLVRDVDVAVIGGGPGGYSAAFRCAELGLETVVVDAGGRLGGVCLHEGCIPSKALLHVAGLIGEAARARELGVEFGEPRVALDTLRRWTAERVVGKLARGLAGVAKARGVDVIAGRAVFDGSRQLRVEGDEPQVLRFGHAVIASGSRPSALPGPAPTGDRVMDSTAALALADLPGRLLVVGGGYIGLELGQVYAALGSKVTLVEMTEGLLPGVDRDLVQPLARRCAKLFTAIHLGTAVTALREAPDGVEADLGAAGVNPRVPAADPGIGGRGGDAPGVGAPGPGTGGRGAPGTERFDRVLVAVGRRPLSDGLGLETTRVRVDGRGTVVIDDRCATTDPRIYAVGDVTGEPMLAHRAMRQGKVAAEAIAGRAAAFDNVVVPAVVFTDPEVAWCGLTETRAEQEGIAVKVARFSWAASGRAATLGRADGLTKLVVDPGSGRVLGVAAVGPGAGELIAEGALAVEAALLAEDLAATIHAHPTLSETLMEAAETFLP